MPDLTIEIMQMCSQLDNGASQTIGKHRLHFFPQFNGWECDCKGYQYRKTCKHVDQAMRDQCTWHQLYGIAQTSEQADACICPECGGKTIYVQVAV